MRGSDVLVGLGALLSGLLGASAAGCLGKAATDDCSVWPQQGKCDLTGTGGNTTGTTTTGSGGDAGGPPLYCDGDPRPLNAKGEGNIRDECAVFVKAAAGGSAGTMKDPVGTLAAAFTLADTRNVRKVFVCADAGGKLTETVKLDAGLEVYGGFDCAAWAWSEAGRTEVDGEADKVAWTIGASAEGAFLSNLSIKALVTPGKTDGSSSVALAIDDVKATVTRCDIEAAPGAQGADGVPVSGLATAGGNAPDVDHTRMDACISPGALLGGAAGTQTCDGVDTSGGTGGIGGITGTNGGNGGDAQAGKNGSLVNGGIGQSDPTANYCSTTGVGKVGSDGAVGQVGDAGGGLGALSISLGVTGGNGGPGGDGTAAQGGGGGGGAKSGKFCAGATDGNGASGGGGGAGGCGGKGGPGGQAGGSSIAVLSLGDKLIIDLTTVKLTAKDGGQGGKGAAGQSGGLPGLGAAGGSPSAISPSKAGCKGGDGGTGGDGGPGGGGRGGHSIAIAYAKSLTQAPTLGTIATGNAGQGGDGGDLAQPALNQGAAGKAAPCWDFAKNVACGS